MVLVQLETSAGELVGKVEVLPFLSAPDAVIWGNRYFKLHQENPPIYREAVVVVSLTRPERVVELSS